MHKRTHISRYRQIQPPIELSRTKSPGKIWRVLSLPVNILLVKIYSYHKLLNVSLNSTIKQPSIMLAQYFDNNYNITGGNVKILHYIIHVRIGEYNIFRWTKIYTHCDKLTNFGILPLNKIHKQWTFFSLTYHNMFDRILF